jgi:hypothetical protein
VLDFASFYVFSGHRKDNISPTELSDMSNILCQIDEQMMDDFPVSSTPFTSS